MPKTLTVLIPAHNEEDSIASTIEAALNQTRNADQIVVIPNGCSDNTAEIARRYPVTVMEMPKLQHRKSEALNLAWQEHAVDSDTVVCLDADTILPPNAFEDWEIQLHESELMGGSSSKFTMLTPNQEKTVLPEVQSGVHFTEKPEGSRFSRLLIRVQKAEFATWTQTALDRDRTTVLAGTGCAIKGQVLREVAAIETSGGPWSYESATEDFLLTHRIRSLGYYCTVSPTVRAYTDSMRTVKSLWGQRMKWQVGTVQDLLHLGWNRLTIRDWMQQLACIFNMLAKVLLVAFWTMLFVTGTFTFIWMWWLLPVLFVSLDIVRHYSIPHRDRKDFWVAVSFFPMEAFMWLRAGWVAASWWKVIVRSKKDLWSTQYQAEGQLVN